MDIKIANISQDKALELAAQFSKRGPSANGNASQLAAFLQGEIAKKNFNFLAQDVKLRMADIRNAVEMLGLVAPKENGERRSFSNFFTGAKYADAKHRVATEVIFTLNGR